MGIYLAGQKVKSLYIGGQKIKSAYIGGQKVFSDALEMLFGIYHAGAECSYSQSSSTFRLTSGNGVLGNVPFAIAQKSFALPNQAFGVAQYAVFAPRFRFVRATGIITDISVAVFQSYTYPSVADPIQNDSIFDIQLYLGKAIKIPNVSPSVWQYQGILDYRGTPYCPYLD